MRTVAPIALLVALLALALPALAQQVSIQAFVDHTTLGDGETLTLTVEISGQYSRLGDVEAPPARGLAVISARPDRQVNVVMQDRRTTRKTVLRWRYQPRQIGEARIEGVSISVDGRIFTTDPIRVQVVPQSQRPITGRASPGTAAPTPAGEGDRDIFLRPIADRNTAYVGQQVIVDYVLYYAPGVQPRNARVTSTSEAAGFWREDMELQTPLASETVMIDDRPFVAVTIKRSAFFPTRSGSLRIDTMAVQMDVLRSAHPSGRSGAVYSPFGSRFHREEVVAPALELAVRPLPDGAPAGFDGAVGRFSLDARPEAVSGDGARVTLTIRGDGNPATLRAPEWPDADGLDIFPPRRHAEVQRGGRRLAAQHRFIYSVVPRDREATHLPPLAWTYFDPEQHAYRTLTTDPIPLDATSPAAPLAERSPRETGPRLAAAAGPWTRSQPLVARYRRPAAMAAFGLPLLALLALVGVRRLRASRGQESAARRSARARASAEAALRNLPDGPAASRAAAMETVIRQFLADRLPAAGDRPFPGRTLPLAELDAQLGRVGIDDESRHRLRLLLARCESAQFAPLASTDLPGVDDVRAALDAIDHQAPKPVP